MKTIVMIAVLEGIALEGPPDVPLTEEEMTACRELASLLTTISVAFATARTVGDVQAVKQQVDALEQEIDEEPEGDNANKEASEGEADEGDTGSRATDPAG